MVSVHYVFCLIVSLFACLFVVFVDSDFLYRRRYLSSQKMCCLEFFRHVVFLRFSYVFLLCLSCAACAY